MKAVLLQRLPKGLREMRIGKVVFVEDDHPLLEDENVIAVFEVLCFNTQRLLSNEVNKIKKAIERGKNPLRILSICKKIKERYRRYGVDLTEIDALTQEVVRLI